MEDVEKLAKSLEKLRAELNSSVGRQELLEQQLKDEFGISPTKIKKKLLELKEARAKAEKDLKRKLKLFRQEWKEYFEDEPCPI